MELGLSWNISDNITKELESFVCELYGKKNSNIDRLRYDIFCAKEGKIEAECLPPCKANSTLHTKRANYQAGIWRRSLIANPVTPSPCDHGWVMKNGNLIIQWMAVQPAPQEVLELLYCSCKRSCDKRKCCCLVASLPCTDMCFLECDHMINNGIISEHSSDDNSDID